MKFKAILVAAMALSTVMFPLSAGPWGTDSVYFYFNSNGGWVGCRAPRLCYEQSWGITTPYFESDICH